MSLAAEVGSKDVLEALLKAGADVESPNAEGQTALMAVARTGKVDAARVLLKYKANPNATEQWGGQTALMWAAAQSQPEMIRALIQGGAKVDMRATVHDWQRRVTAEGRPKDMNRGGFTALLYAARESCIPCAKELLDRGADINLGDPDGVTPLIIALSNIHWDMGKFLIERGADVNLWDFYGQTPLYAAVDMNTLPKGRRVELPAVDDTTGLEIITMLLDRGANPNSQLKLRLPWRQVPYDRYTEPMLNIGVTPLIRATKAGDIPVIKLLLAHGALPNLPNFNGDTPLMAACAKGLDQLTDARRELHRRAGPRGLRPAARRRRGRERTHPLQRNRAPQRGPAWLEQDRAEAHRRRRRARREGRQRPHRDRLRDGPHSEGLQRADAGSAHGDRSAPEGLWREAGEPGREVPGRADPAHPRVAADGHGPHPAAIGHARLASVGPAPLGCAPICRTQGGEPLENQLPGPGPNVPISFRRAGRMRAQYSPVRLRRRRLTMRRSPATRRFTVIEDTAY
jgi:ankyrin repeat protein